MQYSYEAIAQQLEQAIRKGDYAIGARLPSVRQAAQAFDVSVSTLVRCYRLLEQRGFVEARTKSGMYVADWKTQQPRANSRKQIPPQQAFDLSNLVSLQNRLSELYALTAQPLRMGLHLASATPAWYPYGHLAKLMQRHLRQNPEIVGAYPFGSGDASLKNSLVTWLASSGVELHVDDVLITNGSTEALSVALRAVTHPGDTVIVESPCYFGQLQMLESLGLRALAVPCTKEHGLSMEALEFALEHRHEVKAIVLNPNFSNPLGSRMSDKDKRRVLKLAERFDLAIIEDDAFGDVGIPGERGTPIKAWDTQGRVIFCGTCSKSIAPGFRIGWIAAGRYQGAVQSLKLSQSLVTSILEQRVLADFIASAELPLHLRKLRERLSRCVQPASLAVQTYFPAGTIIESCANGWWLWLSLPQHVDTLELLRRSVQQGIAFAPGILFANTDKYRHAMRINIARPWGAEMEWALKVVGGIAKEMG